MNKITRFDCKLYPILVLIGLSACPYFLFASSLHQTQDKLEKVTVNIHQLANKLAQATNKRQILSKELAKTELQISACVLKLHQLQQHIDNKQRVINNLQDKSIQLTQTLREQKELLTRQLRRRYQMGEYQPLKWTLNQDNPYTISRLLTYYQYLIQARTNIINHIQQSKENLIQNKIKLDSELDESQHLQKQLNDHQKQLFVEKKHHHALLQTLSKNIQTRQNKLQEYQQDKEKLAQLLTSLRKKSMIRPAKSFYQMRKKLPFPVSITINKRSLSPMKQGVVFFAKESTAVNAIYSGKVVFSDWLKGYGLLLIIDHGHDYMTLYAHNQSLFKQKGDTVYQGEQIACAGHTGGIKKNGLYFEIRHRGKAIPPLQWLS